MEVLATWCGMIAFAAALLYGMEVAKEEGIKEDECLLDGEVSGRTRNCQERQDNKSLDRSNETIGQAYNRKFKGEEHLWKT